MEAAPDMFHISSGAICHPLTGKEAIDFLNIGIKGLFFRRELLYQISIQAQKVGGIKIYLTKKL